MASYLIPVEAAGRLAAFNITHTPSAGSLEGASRLLDASGPFYGARYDPNQALAFPRTYTAPGDTDNIVPGAILDWVALEAYRIDTDEEPAVTSKSVQHLGSKTYARPRVSKAARLQAGLLDAYQLKIGVTR